MDGAVSMARDGPDTATADFFICVGDQPELDFGGKRNPDGQGFAVFGRVVAGMEVVRRIHAGARGRAGAHARDRDQRCPEGAPGQVGRRRRRSGTGKSITRAAPPPLPNPSLVRLAANARLPPFRNGVPTEGPMPPRASTTAVVRRGQPGHRRRPEPVATVRGSARRSCNSITREALSMRSGRPASRHPMPHNSIFYLSLPGPTMSTAGCTLHS